MEFSKLNSSARSRTRKSMQLKSSLSPKSQRRDAIAVAVFASLIAVGASAEPTLKGTFKDCFLIGAALNEAQFTGKNRSETELITQQFNSITPENVLKWESIHPELEKFNFEAADAY